MSAKLTSNEYQTAESLLKAYNISLIDAARLVLNILDSRVKSSKTSTMEFCHKVIELGKAHVRIQEISVANGLKQYIKTKKHLRADSLRDIKYLSSRMIKTIPENAQKSFSFFTTSDCEAWLAKTFPTAPQFNKGRAMLHSLFEYAMRREWCDRNPVKLVERRKVVEKEIKPLSLTQAKRLIKTSLTPQFKDCAAGVAILTFAGIRPCEVRRLKWSDVDLVENSITVRSQCSKTGGTRQVEICPALKKMLQKIERNKSARICPQNWAYRWKTIRDHAGFKNAWIQDVLRHTYASYHAKFFRDMPRLQLNMGHRDQSLLRARYVNMVGISTNDAKVFFKNVN